MRKMIIQGMVSAIWLAVAGLCWLPVKGQGSTGVQGQVGAKGPLFKLLSAKQTGVHFSNDIKESEDLNVLNYEYFYNGGGVAVGDINNDGLPDLFFTANSKPCKLFLNLGGMKFRDITKEAGLEGRPGGWKIGCRSNV